MGLGGISAWQLIVIGALFLLPLWVFGRISSKAGFSRWWALLMLVPLVNLIMIWVLAFADWPSTRADYIRNAQRDKRQATTFIGLLIASVVIPIAVLGLKSMRENSNGKVVSTVQQQTKPQAKQIQSSTEVNKPHISTRKNLPQTVQTQATNRPTKDGSNPSVNQSVREFVLQLASFKDLRNAKALNTDLQKSGYASFIDEGTAGLVRVYIGPDTKENLTALKEEIRREYALDGSIVQYGKHSRD